ncbi:unnamed protein product, partial [Nesidiocoris tenuis]
AQEEDKDSVASSLMLCRASRDAFSSAVRCRGDFFSCNASMRKLTIIMPVQWHVTDFMAKRFDPVKNDPNPSWPRPAKKLSSRTPGRKVENHFLNKCLCVFLTDYNIGLQLDMETTRYPVSNKHFFLLIVPFFSF